MDVRSFTEQIIESKLEESGWLKHQARNEFSPAGFYLSFNMIHRKVEDIRLEYSEKEISQWKALYPGFRPEYWTSQTVARLYLILHVPGSSLVKILDDLFTTGDIGEQESLYRILFILPEPKRFKMRAAEGIRTNMTRVFDAIALDNPYPAEFFNTGQWNQMVLKSIFMDRPLYRIQGIDKRNNEDLCRIAQDFAHERWAASRKVTPELWRLTGSFAAGNKDLLKDLSRVLKSNDRLEQGAGALALSDCGTEDCRSLLNGIDGLMVSSWDELGKIIESEK